MTRFNALNRESDFLGLRSSKIDWFRLKSRWVRLKKWVSNWVSSATAKVVTDTNQ